MRERQNGDKKRASVGVYYYDSFLPMINKVVKGFPATFTYFFPPHCSFKGTANKPICRFFNIFLVQLLFVCVFVQMLMCL